MEQQTQSRFYLERIIIIMSLLTSTVAYTSCEENFQKIPKPVDYVELDGYQLLVG
ncbi:MAG: hypothetical protein HQM14_10620 [SAR324 cluster bacterium]|nr:hypothetical protein [SAR324 cluster bacterium]